MARLRTSRERVSRVSVETRADVGLRPPRRVHVLLLTALALVAARSRAHPFDELRIDSRSRFGVAGDEVSVELRFPLYAYLNLQARSREHYDALVRALEEKGEVASLRAYVAEHLRAFDGETPLVWELERLELEPEPGEAGRLREFVVLRGRFRHTRAIGDLYLFNDLFREGDAEHYGSATIEHDGLEYHFVFRPKQYFHLEIP